MLAQIEQATKVMAAAHKGMHQAQSEEFDLIVNLFREQPSDFWGANKACPKDFWDETRFLTAVENCQLAPKSDPNVPSHLHRVMKALALVQLIGVEAFKPYMSAKETLLRCLRIIREDPGGLVIDPAPQAGAQDLQGQAKVMEAEVKAKKLPIDAQIAAGKLQAEQAKMASNERIAGIEYQKEALMQAEDAEGKRRQADLAERKQMHEEVCADDDSNDRRQSETLDRLLELARQTSEDRKDALDRGLEERKLDLDEKRVRNEEYAVRHPPKKPKGK
jgi:hypothetical protein